jgi:hypothetical protein
MVAVVGHRSVFVVLDVVVVVVIVFVSEVQWLW